MPKAPEKRLRSKTPDPGRTKSPDPKKLKKAEAAVNKSKKNKKDPGQKTLSFKAEPTVTVIQAENPAGSGKPNKKSKPRRKMSTEEAEKILEEMELVEPSLYIKL